MRNCRQFLECAEVGQLLWSLDAKEQGIPSMKLRSIRSALGSAKAGIPVLDHLARNTRTELAFKAPASSASNGLTVKEALSQHDANTTVEDFLVDLIADPSVATAAAADEIPIPTEANREGYYQGRPFVYWASGLYDYRRIQELVGGIREHGRILDFGGSSGRVMRHFANNHPDMEVIVADRFLSAVDFVNSNFPNNAYGLPVFSSPHLAIEDNSCDVVTAFSVFTHIDDQEIAWLSELRRVLKPGGKAYLTIHSGHTWKTLEGTLLEGLLRNSPTFDSSTVFGGEMPGDRLVFEPAGRDLRAINVFHSDEYIEQTWGRLLKVLEFVPAGHGYQTVVVLEKPYSVSAGS